MEPLRTKWRGKEFQLSYTLEVTFWRSERLPEIAKDQRSRGAPANATSASFSRKWSVPGITRQWGGGPRSRSASLAMGPANARTSGEPTRLRTHARVCGPNSVVPMAEAIRRSEPTASPGARNVPSSRRSKRTSVWSPAVRFARIASRGLVGANPAAGNGTVVVRPNLYAWRPNAPAADVRIETPWTMRVRIMAAAARKRRSIWVVAVIGSPGTRNATTPVAAAARRTWPSSTSWRGSRPILRPAWFLNGAGDSPGRAHG